MFREGNIFGVYSHPVCRSAIDGQTVMGAAGSLRENTEVTRYIDTASEELPLADVKNDFKELKLKSNSKAGLYIELASRLYLRFKSSSFDEIHYKKTGIRIDSEDPEDSYLFQFGMLDPGIFLMTLYALHTTLMEKWDKGDGIKAQRLMERIEEAYPEHASYLANFNRDIKKKEMECFVEHLQQKMSVSDFTCLYDNQPLVNLPVEFLHELRVDKDMQYKLRFLIDNQILGRIYDKKPKDSQKWNWGFVKIALFRNGLLIDNSISPDSFAANMFLFLPQKFIDKKLANQKDKEKGKKNFVSSIKQQVYNHDDDLKKEPKTKDAAERNVAEIVELLNKYDLHKPAI